MRRQFGKTICEIARQDAKVVLLYADVKQNMDDFEREFPDRIFNVGICEQSMVSMAAGMALEGMIPFVYSLTPFIFERALEQWKMDVDIQNARVIGCGYAFYPHHGPSQSPIDGCGLWLNSIPWRNIIVYRPDTALMADAVYLEMWEAYRSGKPAMMVLTKDFEI